MHEMERRQQPEAAHGAQHEEKFVCDRCFDDYAIKDFIKAHVNARLCSFCGRRNVRKDIAALGRDVLAFILRGLRSEYDYVDNHALPYDDEEGRYTVPVYDMWDLMHDQLPEISSNEAVLDWIVKSFSDGRQWCDRTPLSLSPEEGLISGWEDFCEEVKHKTRYLFFEPEPVRGPEEFPPPGEEPHYIRPAELLEEMADVVRGVGLIRELPAGTRIFRVRPHDLGTQFSTPVDLGPPSADLAKAGRMNAPGIGVFYGALHEATAIAETGRRKPAISIGTFELLRPIRVLDLTNLPQVPSIFDESGFDQRAPLRFLHHFCRDISEPIYPDDRVHVEYTPTQVVSEFIKLRFKDQDDNSVDGVLYPSSRRRLGQNIVLFANRDNIEGIPSEWHSDSPKLLRLTTAKTVSVQDRIRDRAYTLYVQRGRRNGFALNDWLDAEDEILGPEPQSEGTD